MASRRLEGAFDRVFSLSQGYMDAVIGGMFEDIGLIADSKPLFWRSSGRFKSGGGIGDSMRVSEVIGGPGK